MVPPGFVLLVEFKAVRPAAMLGLGLQHEFGDEQDKELGKAIGRQITTTTMLIRDRHTKFTHVLADRPAFGLVVTREEPFHVVNIPEFPAARLDDVEGATEPFPSSF
ncbi:hypothetical protein ABZ154_31930 [Streptomyces sp. NPDC006261]|uniref:hypothetical protein n=1 Tax=Streptomyces sp. NPDC006261 TaxID=3156739 RepID=UPI0033B57687